MALNGILPLDKPLGWTSHDAVARVRRLAGQRQVGHAGTLDPLATGLLILVLGSATRLSSYLMDSEKTYCAEVVLGATTVTDDAEAPLATQADTAHLTAEHVESCLRGFVGTIDQVPPAYAAVRQGGQKLYKLARQGVEITPAPRRVTIREIELLAWQPGRDGQPAWLRLRVRCGAGTYLRSLARDVGAALGVGGYLHALRRVASGTFCLGEAVTLETLGGYQDLRAALVPPDRAVLDWPAAVLTPRQVALARTGQPVSLGDRCQGNVRLYGPSGDLVGLGEATGSRIKPTRVFV